MDCKALMKKQLRSKVTLFCDILHAAVGKKRARKFLCEDSQHLANPNTKLGLNAIKYQHLVI